MGANFQKILVCFLAFVLGLGYGSPAKADKEAALKAVINAWKKRQKETTSFHFEWTEKSLIPKEQLPVPAKEDVKVQMKAGIVVSDSRMTTYSEGPHWNQDCFISERYRSVFDGASSKSVHIPIPEAIRPFGNINNIKMNQDADSNFCIAIQLAFRAFHPVIGRFDEDKIQVIEEKELFRDRKCIRIEQKKGAYVARCWVDPSQAYVIVRYDMVFDGFTSYQCDIKYKFDNKFGYLPDSWHDVIMNRHSTPVKSRLSTDRGAQVTSFTINGAVEAQEFQLEFPPGTEVKDWIKNERFVVRKNGERRVATSEENERGVTYEELLQPEEKNWGGIILATSSIAAMGMFLGYLLFWNLKKRRKNA